MAIAAIETHRWTRREYDGMAEEGLLRPEDRIELLDGVIYTMSPNGSGHATAIVLIGKALLRLYPEDTVRCQLPLVLGKWSEPEPDFAVAPGSPREYSDSHPTTALLVVEVADSSLRHDRLRKLPLYAQAGIPEYWILDLAGRALEVYRDPAGGTYCSRTVLRAGDHVSPVSRPDASIPIADLLP